MDVDRMIEKEESSCEEEIGGAWTLRAWLSVTIARCGRNTYINITAAGTLDRAKRPVEGECAFHGGRVDEKKKARSKK